MSHELGRRRETGPAAEPCGPSLEEHWRSVYSWALPIVGRPHDALDVAQDVLLRFVARGGEAAAEQPRAWLRRATINRSIDMLRARKRSGPAGAAEATPGTPCADTVEREELRFALTEAMQDLSESQSAVLTAKVFHEMTFAEIAAEQGIAIPTAKTHYMRALRALRNRLRPAEGDTSP